MGNIPSVTMDIRAGDTVSTIEVFEDMQVKFTTNMVGEDVPSALNDIELIFTAAIEQLRNNSSAVTLNTTH